MLHELHVTDLGVIEDVDVGFDPGLNVLTGETGAGKTMITVALALALGRRTSSALVRDGSRSARVQARFDATPAADEGGWSEDRALVLARTIEADGRSSARAGAQIVPASVLEALAGDLVEVHGQHESTLLRTASAQTAFLDRFAGEGHLREVAAFGDAFTRLRRVNTEVEELERRERDREREADVLAFQIGEIEAVAPRPGELEELNAEAARLANVERIVDRATAAERAAAIDGGAAERLAIAASALEEVAALDPDAGSLAQRATTLGEEASELARDLRRYSDAIDADPARLDELNARIAAVRSLLRKYGATEEDVLEFLGTARDRIAALGSANQRRAELRRDVAALTARVDAAASAISVARAETAPRLAAAIEAELTELGMAGARVSVELRPAEAAASGVERAEFLFAGGPRQRSLPLAKVASGGELSRTMLACRTVLGDAEAARTLVFDEVDAGIGGAAAAAVGRRLAALARERQVLVVTHLPQIAAFADRHIVVRKARGTATASPVEGEERVAELSRMLAGVPESDAATAHAEELLQQAGRIKSS